MAKKMRSPNYPSIGLPDALAEVQKIWDKEKRTAVSMDVLAAAMGYKSVSGPVRTKIAALRKYGLLDQTGGRYSLSEIAMKALHGQPEEQAQARASAAQRPELFREFITTHPDASDAALKSELVLRRSFSEAGAKQFIKAFRETMSIADPSKASYSGAQDIEEPEDMPETVSARLNPILTPPPAHSGEKRVSFNWPVSKDVVAEVTFRGGEVNVSHLKTLAKYLELMQSAIEEMKTNN